MALHGRGYDKDGDGKADPVLKRIWMRCKIRISFPCIVLKKGPSYHMLYSGGVNETNEGIGYAISIDGLNWIKDSNNPIFHNNDGVVWRNRRVYTH